MSVGTLLGKVLPFTEETSSNDQSKVDREVETADMLDIPEMLALRESAVAIRSMIRVKMADANDFKQVIQSLLLVCFGVFSVLLALILIFLNIFIMNHGYCGVVRRKRL